MFDYRSHFDKYCRDHTLDLVLSFNMPAGYETANGTFDAASKTVFINAAVLNDAPDCEKAFYLFHELRHASQYLRPELFSGAVNRSLGYVIMYDGTCYKIVDGEYIECRLEDGEDYFTKIYLGQPYEVDANTFAYAQTRELYGDSEELRKLYEFWVPRQSVPDELYDSIYDKIDEMIKK
jgi:hypothetical protein